MSSVHSDDDDRLSDASSLHHTDPIENSSGQQLIIAKEEYMAQLMRTLTPLIFQGIQTIREDAETMCEKDPELDEERGPIIQFQLLLKEVPKWNQTLVDQECDRIRDICPWLIRLIGAVLIMNVKILQCVDPRDKHRQETFKIKLPSLGKFIHMVYIECARAFYYDPLLWEDVPLPPSKKRQITDTIHESIEEVVRNMLPIASMLDTFLSETMDGKTNKKTSRASSRSSSRSASPTPPSSPRPLSPVDDTPDDNPPDNNPPDNPQYNPQEVPVDNNPDNNPDTTNIPTTTNYVHNSPSIHDDDDDDISESGSSSSDDEDKVPKRADQHTDQHTEQHADQHADQHTNQHADQHDEHEKRYMFLDRNNNGNGQHHKPSNPFRSET